jgi:PAS domain S-box-containing protein
MASATTGERRAMRLSSGFRAELLDPESWWEVLAAFARTMKLGIALTDAEGRIIGTCHNPQPVWSFARDKRPEAGAGCSFCLAPRLPCHAAAEALQSGRSVMVRDRAGLAHVAVPLSLGEQYLGTLLAGQVFDRIPERLALQRVATELSIPEPQLWEAARRQPPINRAALQTYGDLLGALGRAFLQERYDVIVQRKLAATNRGFRSLIDSVKEYALFMLDAAGCVTSWNSGAERLFGYTESEIVGQKCWGIFTPEDMQTGAPGRDLQKTLRDGWVNGERWQVRKDGTRFLASSTLARVGDGEGLEFGMIMHDISGLRDSEGALFENRKLESIGVIAGGIAHEFNNLLAGIVVNASSLLEDSPQLVNRTMIEDIVAAGEQAANLVNQLLAYAGKGSFATSRVDLSHLVSGALPLIRASISNNVNLQVALASGLPWIDADAGQIQQIAMNLALNGAEANRAEGGIVRISTGVAGSGSLQENQPGPCVYLQVYDSGHGMDAATCSRIFDPFFTTKFLGRGLGLAAVSGIVRRHKGRVEVASVPGQGSTFTVFLPAFANGADDPNISHASPP